jgi:hypothetical protein
MTWDSVRAHYCSCETTRAATRYTTPLSPITRLVTVLSPSPFKPDFSSSRSRGIGAGHCGSSVTSRVCLRCPGCGQRSNERWPRRTTSCLSRLRRAVSRAGFGQEVSYWLRLGRRDRLLLVLSAGQLTWAQRDFDWIRTDALPPVLRGVFDQEPLHVDLRWARTQDVVSRRDVRLTEPLASLAAPMQGRSRDALIGEDLLQHKRTLRIARSAVITLVVLLLAAVMASVVAVSQRDRAEREARIALAHLLGNESVSVGPDGVDVAFLLAAQAYAAEPDASSWGALAEVLIRNPALAGYLPNSAGATIVLAAPDGEMLAVGDKRGAVTLWRAVRRERLRVLASSLRGGVTALAFSGDGGRLIAGDDTGGYAVWEIGSGRLVHSGTLPGTVRALGLDSSGIRFAADTDRVLVFGHVGDAPQRLSEQEFATRLVFGTDTLTAAGGQGEMVTWQLSTGRRVADNNVGLGQPVASAFTPDLRLFAGVTVGNLRTSSTRRRGTPSRSTWASWDYRLMRWPSIPGDPRWQ